MFLEIFPGKDLNLLKFQTFSLIKKNNKVSGWTKEEDEILAKVVLYPLSYLEKTKIKINNGVKFQNSFSRPPLNSTSGTPSNVEKGGLTTSTQTKLKENGLLSKIRFC